MKIALDAGHGINTPGKRTPDDEREWSFNDMVVRYIITLLRDYVDAETIRVDDYTGRTDTPLAARVNQANNWKAGAYVSVHQNASDGKWGTHGGTETYHFPGSLQSKKLAESVHPNLIRSFKLKDRGIKEADFYVLKNTNMPAILTEGAFMDSRIDIVALRDESRLRAQAEGIVLGLANHFGLKKKEVAGVTNEPTLNAAQEKVRQEAMKLGITDGKNPFREVNQYYVWNALLPLAKEIEELKNKLK
ncbi:N-acetylmuramoyl-L-alanine amidase [Psychrobacillus antarcticus]|uniref:N-acetylmuramoyl-L-alanine amidase n=1 Tax=Psychrobacillus antarcticus TaxID=2879115 RepID=UPI002407881F|nr:N-acetylmuramoyl-L-alanine amidase [Psychrobacillus antarcticus]